MKGTGLVRATKALAVEARLAYATGLLKIMMTDDAKSESEEETCWLNVEFLKSAV
jgi:uncharacterized tellurite resistance protein B-like protein